MIELRSEFASDVNSDRFFFEIFEKDTRQQVAAVEKKENGKFELYLVESNSVDAEEFLRLLQKGIQEL